MKMIVLIMACLVMASCANMNEWTEKEKQTAMIAGAVSLIAAAIIISNDDDHVHAEHSHPCVKHGGHACLD